MSRDWGILRVAFDRRRQGKGEGRRGEMRQDVGVRWGDSREE